MNTDVHEHSNPADIHSCTNVRCRARSLISASIEDLRCSLNLYTAKDLPLLKIALAFAQAGRQNTMARMIQAKISKLSKAQGN